MATHRKLAAIFSADAVGNSRLMADEGSVCISGTAFDQVEGKPPLQFKFSSASRRSRTLPVRFVSASWNEQSPGDLERFVAGMHKAGLK